MCSTRLLNCVLSMHRQSGQLGIQLPELLRRIFAQETFVGYRCDPSGVDRVDVEKTRVYTTKVCVYVWKELLFSHLNGET